MAQQVGDLAWLLDMVAALAWVQSLAQGLPHTVGAAKKEKKKNQLFSQQKWVNLEIAENCNMGQACYTNSMGKSNKGEETLF